MSGKKIHVLLTVEQAEGTDFPPTYNVRLFKNENKAVSACRRFAGKKRLGMRRTACVIGREVEQ